MILDGAGGVNGGAVSGYDNEPLPARTAFAVNGLALGAKVEIECIAVINET